MEAELFVERVRAGGLYGSWTRLILRTCRSMSRSRATQTAKAHGNDADDQVTAGRDAAAGIVPAASAAMVLSMVGRLSLADAAAAYAAVGLAVFPCVPGGKRPLTRHGLSDASGDPGQIARWWRRWPGANIGLATGVPDGFVVVDVDVHPSGSGFPALGRAGEAGLLDGWAALVASPSGGVHMYFPAGDRGERSWALARVHVDFRGLGGYVICPPSLVGADDGRRYGYRLIAMGSDPRPLDAGALRALLAPTRREPGVLRHGPDRVDWSAGRLAAWLAMQPAGNRNRALFWAACRQAEAGKTEQETRALLGVAAARTGLAEREIETTLASAFRTLARERGEIAGCADRLAR